MEVGAARVVNGEIVDRFQSLVNPYKPISPKATAVHGYTDADVAGAPPFQEVFTQFRAFVGDDVLIAHNGMKFDVPVLRRLAAGRDGVDTLTFYDTFPLVRSLSQDSPKQEDIAHRFGIDCGQVGTSSWLTARRSSSAAPVGATPRVAWPARNPARAARSNWRSCRPRVPTDTTVERRPGRRRKASTASRTIGRRPSSE